jgi:hypothetical protein
MHTVSTAVLTTPETTHRFLYSSNWKSWDSGQGQEIVLFSITSGLALGLTQPPIQLGTQ